MSQRVLVAIAVFFSLTLASFAQPTVGIKTNDSASFEGYTLFGPASNFVYLIDNGGRVVHQWDTSRFPGQMGYLRPNGNLVRAGAVPDPPLEFASGNGGGGIVEEFDWDGNLIWSHRIADSQYFQHHDIEPMNNGNVLVFAWEYLSDADAIAAGRDPAKVGNSFWPEVIYELQPNPPGADIVWEWRLWDHIIQDFDNTKPNFGVVEDHPELVNLNHATVLGDGDWAHFNTIDYNEELDQIIVSPLTFNEVWVIDHSTTTAEAAGHTGGNSGMGGDILYRWGNPEAYGRGTPADRAIYRTHDIQWIESGIGAGNFLIYNNGVGRPGGIDFSTSEEFISPADVLGNYPALAPGQPHGPTSLTWSYTAPDPASFFSAIISGTQRLENGNTLIIQGVGGRLFEVTQGGQIVWEYVNPVTDNGVTAQGMAPPGNNAVFKARRYPLDYAAFTGRDLTPGNPLETLQAPSPSGAGSLTAAKGAGDAITVQWDASCASDEYNLLHGQLAQVASFENLSAECGVGTTGTFDWTAPPAGSRFFLIAGTDPTGIYESSLGTDSSGAERNGSRASFTCGTTTKVDSPTCP